MRADADAALVARLARRRCDVCGMQGELSERPFPVCDACRIRRYCGPECASADFITHRRSCPGITGGKGGI